MSRRAGVQVHYGYASLAPASALPAFHVFGRSFLNAGQVAAEIGQYLCSSPNLHGCPALVVVLDQPLLHAAGQLQELLVQDAAQVRASNMPGLPARWPACQAACLRSCSLEATAWELESLCA